MEAAEDEVLEGVDGVGGAAAPLVVSLSGDGGRSMFRFSPLILFAFFFSSKKYIF